jgi:hypothetical protein
MTIAAPLVELRLLTHQPKEMETWWGAMLDGTPRPLSSRTTVIAGRALRLVIERSQIAFAYHPEACGVTAIGLTFEDLPTVHRTLNRLADLGSRPHRATREAGVTTLWLRDPKGGDVAVRMPPPAIHPAAEACGPPEELDVNETLADIDHHQREDPAGHAPSPADSAQRVCCADICTDGCVVGQEI